MPLLKRRTSKTIAGLGAEVMGFSDKIELDGSSATFFTVQCTKEGSTWMVEKRYSEFFGFELDLRTQVEIAAPFPPKLAKLSGLTQSQKEERRVAINKWVSELLRQPLSSTVLAQCYNFFEVMANIDMYESKSSMRRHTPGRVLYEGYVAKLGGNKDDPYNLTKGTWSRRYMVLQDDIKYFADEQSWRKGGAAKGSVSLDNFFVTAEGGASTIFTLHAVPWPLICKADDPAQAQLWVEALEDFAYAGFEPSMVPGSGSAKSNGLAAQARSATLQAAMANSRLAKAPASGGGGEEVYNPAVAGNSDDEGI